MFEAYNTFSKIKYYRRKINKGEIDFLDGVDTEMLETQMREFDDEKSTDSLFNSVYANHASFFSDLMTFLIEENCNFS